MSIKVAVTGPPIQTSPGRWHVANTNPNNTSYVPLEWLSLPDRAAIYREYPQIERTGHDKDLGDSFDQRMQECTDWFKSEEIRLANKQSLVL